MSQTYRSLDEQWLLKVSALERRIQSLERSGAGQAFSMAGASGTLALTLVSQDVPGCTLNIVRPGLYLVMATFRISVTVVAAGAAAIGNINPTGHSSSNPAGNDTTLSVATLADSTVFAMRIIAWQAAGSVKTTALMSGGAGTATVLTGATRIAAIRTGPA